MLLQYCRMLRSCMIYHYKGLRGVTRGYMGIQGIKSVPIWLQGVVRGHRGLLGVKRSYRGLQRVTRCYNGLREVTRGYKGIKGIYGDYKGLQRVTRVTEDYGMLLEIQGVTRHFGRVSRVYKGLQGATTTTTITLFIHGKKILRLGETTTKVVTYLSKLFNYLKL